MVNPNAKKDMNSRPRANSWIYRNMDSNSEEPIGGCMSYVLVAATWFMVGLTFPFSLCCCLKVIKEYERAVVFRLGKLMPGGARGPGLVFLLPCIDTYRKVDLRVISFDVPPQEILSKDSVTVSVDAVIYFHISNPTISVTNVNDPFYSTKLLAQTTMRNILGTKTLAEMLSEREHIAEITEKVLDEGTDPWGVKVDRVEVKDIRLPEQLMRAMAAEAEATREAKAKVIAAEGEQKSSRALREAAFVISENPAALQLRYLQTLSGIAAEHNSTIVFPIPMDLINQLTGRSSGTSGGGWSGGGQRGSGGDRLGVINPMLLGESSRSTKEESVRPGRSTPGSFARSIDSTISVID